MLRSPRSRVTAAYEPAAAVLADARIRSALADFIGDLLLYCQNEDCPAREITVRIKELDGAVPSDLRCPACRRRLRLHAVLTLDEVNGRDERRARWSVNAQRWCARHPGQPMPIRVILDDSLLPETR